MDHIAIMSPKRHLIAKILSGEKTIESRWYRNKIAPWGAISAGDTIYFKDSGKQITARAVVVQVKQHEIHSVQEGVQIAKEYEKQICLSKESLLDTSWLVGKRYIILISIAQAKPVLPFKINKKGFGSACAWITTPSITHLTCK